MIQTSQAYKDAITADARAIEIFAVVDISDPDKKYLPVTASQETPWSKKEELHDYDLSAPPEHITFEVGRSLLDGTGTFLPDNYVVKSEVGYASEATCDSDGNFPIDSLPYVSLNFSNVRVLQAFSLYFSTNKADGVPYDFTVEVSTASGQAFYTQTVTGNTETQVEFKGFTVYSPTSIKLTVSRWSLPDRRVRLSEMVMGYFERWTGDMLESFSARLQGKFDVLTIPYGTVDIGIDNSDRRFEPRRKDSIFQSIEERQGVTIYIGCDTEAGMERLGLGVFYQAGDGWKTSDNGIIMKWSLVDIIGLVAQRTYIPPSTLPTTLSGWIKSVVSQLGDAFVNRWHVDPDYANKTVTANSKDDVTDVSCGDIIRWACMATGTWPRARQEDGALTAEPLWNQGNKYTLDNLTKYPTMKANESLAALIFQLADGNNTEYVVSGNSTSSEKTVTVQNPFIHTSDQAITASRLILSQYGGNVLELSGRGNPSSEIGDVDTVWLDESNAASARRMSQTFQIKNGAMADCSSTLLQADGSYLYTEFAVMEDDEGDWTAPDGVTEFRLVLSDGGQGGGYGEEGYIRDGWSGVESGYGEPGKDGRGGKVWYDTINLNPGEIVHYKRGAGGAAASSPGAEGSLGQPSTFGTYSSENGTVYPIGYTDISNGKTYSRTGVQAPLPGTGDGGKGGDGGEPGSGYREYVKNEDGEEDGRYYFHITKRPGKGKPGVAGASGLIMISWDKPSEQSIL